MNTDNMSILGQTIDYGPYGWLDNYDPDWTPNTTDASGRRYRFGNQPQVALWNLAQMANAVVSLFPSIQALQDGVDLYSSTFTRQIRKMLLSKLGLVTSDAEADSALTDDLLELMSSVETDMTIFYRRLAILSFDESAADSDQRLLERLTDAWYRPEQITADHQTKVIDWLHRYRERARECNIPDQVRRPTMNANNPKYVLRNYMAQLAIDRAGQGDYSLIAELLELLRHPYDEQPDQDQFAVKRPDWARHRAGCSMLSCSS